jgi:hypothetical protein
MTFVEAIKTLNRLAREGDACAKSLSDQMILFNERPSFGDYNAVADRAVAYVEAVTS